METITRWATSRTVWTCVAMFFYFGFSGIHDVVPGALQNILDLGLPIMAGYFRINTKAVL